MIDIENYFDLHRRLKEFIPFKYFMTLYKKSNDRQNK